jgi:uncharacterized protein (DUF362 family)
MKNINRRKFIKSGVILGGAAWLGSQIPFKLSAFANPDEIPDIVSITAGDPMLSMEKLLAPLGGIKNFVPQGSTVGVLVNSPWKNPGYYTDPDVALSVIRLCRDSGAKNIVCFKPVPDGYWSRGKLHSEMSSFISEIKYGSDRITVPVNGKSLKEAEIFKIFQEVDVYISIPVAKHHNGCLYSGNLKGLMGVSSSMTNRSMHSPDSSYTYDNHTWLAQCIADLNLIRKPDLCVIDATVCAVSNGPAGPGDTTSPGLIIAGTDPVATDVYSATIIGFDPKNILTFAKAEEHKLGTTDLSKLDIRQL